MLIDNNQATIELSDHEVSVFLGKTTATEAMLESEDLPKPHTTFLNKVEYSAEKVYFVTERPVIIRTVSQRSNSLIMKSVCFWVKQPPQKRCLNPRISPSRIRRFSIRSNTPPKRSTS